MSDIRFTLVTLEYPPQRGGIATYLASLVAASQGAVEVIKAKDFWSRVWPQWWPLIFLCLKQNRTIFVSHVFPIGTAAIISRLLGGPEYVVLFHGTDLRQVRSAWKHWLLKMISRHAKQLIVNSESTKQELIRLIPDAQPLILLPAVTPHVGPTRDEARRQLGIAHQDILFLSIARLVPRKGIDMVIRGLGQTANSNIRYVVIGSGPDKERLEDVAREVGVNVTWIENASEEQKNTWLSAADIFILPGRDEGHDVEGFGIVFLEAAAAGLPVIAGKSGGVAEAVIHGQTGLLVDPLSSSEVSDAIHLLAEDPALRQKLGESGRARAMKDFRWEERWECIREAILCSSVIPTEEARRRAEESLRSDGAAKRSLGSAWDDRGESIAIIIPCFNHAYTLRRTLESLAAQTLQPKEIVVIDDGSVDAPETVVREFEQRLPVRLVRFSANRGAPAARNEGAHQTAAPVLLFLDADVDLVPDALQTYVQTLLEHPDSDFAYANFRWGRKLFRGKLFNPVDLRACNFIHTSSVMRRAAFPGFDESLKKFQDWDLWLTMVEQGYRGIWIDRELFHVEPRRQGISHWLPSFMHKIPWPIFGFTPSEIRRYREAERIIKQKHNISPPDKGDKGGLSQSGNPSSSPYQGRT